MAAAGYSVGARERGRRYLIGGVAVTELERYRDQFAALGLRLGEDGVEVENPETCLARVQFLLEKAAERPRENGDSYERAAELVRMARETLGDKARLDPRPAFGIVLQSVARWRREALQMEDEREYASRDKKLLELEHFFTHVLGPLWDHWPKEVYSDVPEEGA